MGTRVVVTCDRCGKDFPCPEPMESSVWQVGLWQNFVSGGVSEGREEGEAIYSIYGDLCDECVESLQQWMTLPQAASCVKCCVTRFARSQL